MLPDWRLPPGTDRGVWDYVHDATLATDYDDRLADSPLLRTDLAFCERRFPTRGRLIDLGCGTGRLLVPFARRGFDCVGVDLSDAMLAAAKRKLLDANVRAALVKANLVELNGFADAAFDYAACLFSTLGMIRGRDNRAAFLAHVRRILRPGGAFVVHAHNRGFALTSRSGRRRWLGNRWRAWLGREEWGDQTMPQHHGGAPVTLHHFSRREVARELRQAGFEVVEVTPVGAGADGRLRAAWCWPGLRAYGYLIAARARPAAAKTAAART
jgi:ubiquinone/menaquinone biosynthesis C-methylase UbiE